MITHVVMFRFKAENKDENIAHAIERLRAMVGVVPSLRELEVGRHVGLPERACDLALITRFDDLPGLSLYADHPFHVEVKKFLAGVLETSYVVDFAAASN